MIDMKNEALKLADDMEGRAKIRRQAKDRLSVQEGANDRLSDQLEQASDIIRKLVAELDEKEYRVKELTKRYSALARTEFDKQGKPVAWMDKETGMVSRLHQWADAIPLYTAPHHASDVKQTKPLNDEEIAEIYHSENRISPQGNFDYYGFARAIEERHGIK